MRLVRVRGQLPDGKVLARRGFCVFLTVWTLSLVLAPPSWAQLVAAVLPSSRSVQVGTPATAFATIINTSSITATGCVLSPLTSVPATFVFQTTNPTTNQVTGTANTPVDIAAGVAQSFVFAFTPTSPFASTEVQLSFDCTNTNPAPVNSGLNTLLLSAATIPIPDIVALAATLNNDGIANILGTTGTGVFAVATVNVGASEAITASADTGGAALPVTISICETNPTTGACLAPPGPSVTTQINANATPTFGIFATGAGTVPFDPGTNRIFVRFRDAGGVVRGATSVAVRTFSLLEGATNFTMGSPDPAMVTFTERDGTSLQVLAFPGQVDVVFNLATSLFAATQAIQVLGGTILAQIPNMGFYLAGVAPGSEAAFITAIRQNSAVLDAAPNLVLSGDQALPVPLDLAALNQPVPLNVPAGVSSIIIDDDFNTAQGHGTLVSQANTTSGGTVGARISIRNLPVGPTSPTQPCGAVICPSLDRVSAAIAAASEGNRIFNPGNPTIINLSRGQAPDCSRGPCSADATYAARFELWMRHLFRIVNSLPPDLQQSLLITKSLGNGAQDLTAALQRLRQNAVFNNILDRNFLLVEASDTTTPNPAYPDGVYSDRATDPAIVRIAGCIAGNGCGTSFAGPRVQAIFEQVQREFPALTPQQVRTAVTTAQRVVGPTGVLTLDIVRQQAQQILAPPSAPSSPTEASCCVQTGGCPGETGTSCGVGCCCCPLGQRCCPDVTLGCCFVGTGSRVDPSIRLAFKWPPAMPFIPVSSSPCRPAEGAGVPAAAPEPSGRKASAAEVPTPAASRVHASAQVR